MTKEQEASTRLPCRGCISGCENYDSCAGKLWRQEPANVKTNTAKPESNAN